MVIVDELIDEIKSQPFRINQGGFAIPVSNRAERLLGMLRDELSRFTYPDGRLSQERLQHLKQAGYTHQLYKDEEFCVIGHIIDLPIGKVAFYAG
tara:strand:+ start:1453 stop:1737 length:285 start_codon:yes stop_codon:yes gene_type:complete